jgi:hypothetical protein
VLKGSIVAGLLMTAVLVGIPMGRANAVVAGPGVTGGDSRHSQDDDIRPVGLRSLSMPLETRLARRGPAVGRLGPASLSRVLL